MKDIFYLISDPTQNVPEADDIFEKRLAEEGFMCGDCRSILKPKSIDIYLQEKIKASFAPFTYARGTRITMMRKDILGILGNSLIESVFFIGSVYDENKKLSDDYISLVPKKQTHVRGGEESTLKFCEKCGSLLYFPLPLTKWYITKDSVQNDFLFPSDFPSGIIICEDIHKRLKESAIKKIGYDKLPVLESSLDNNDKTFEKYFNNI